MAKKEYDIIVFGATSFVGQIICRYMLDKYPLGGDIKWAAAGRSANKLSTLIDDLGATGLPVIVADAADETGLRKMCEQTRVVISTVGPYAFYGEPLVKVCVELGTAYCDLTGEVQWIDQMIRTYENSARKSGAQIVHCCGFDSIPSDLGVFFLQNLAQAQYGQPCQRVKMRVKSMKGGASGGTVASLLNVVKEASSNSELRKALKNPYLLCPANFQPNVEQPDVMIPTKDKDFSSWAAAFVMAGINTRIVHRTNGLGGGYGHDFQYDEAVLTGGGVGGWLAAQGLTAALGSFVVLAGIAPTRWLLEKTVLPAPGEGPSPKAQKAGFYDIRFFGKTATGKTVRARVTGDRDPGYGSTAKMIVEAGICLAKGETVRKNEGGFWTPATIFGDHLIKRLTDNAGLTFKEV